MPTWNADQYLKFAEERARPCRDLAARIAVNPVRTVMDLGCGPGNSTKILAGRWPDAEITGLDNSPDMMDVARREQPRHKWVLEDITAWADGEGEKYDVVFSNAALQWVDDLSRVFPRLLTRVAPRGALAAQMPGNFSSPAHQIMREMAGSRRVREWRSHHLTFYYDLLAPLSQHVDFWSTEYLHVLPDADAVVEWYKGSGLRPFLDVLDSDADRERFAAEYRDRIREEYPPRPDGRVLLPFRRVFLVATPVR